MIDNERMPDFLLREFALAIVEAMDRNDKIKCELQQTNTIGQEAA